MELQLLQLSTGKPKNITLMGKDYYTGIMKKPVNRPLLLTELGIDGDGVGDLKHHGGTDKAVCAHFLVHYAHWSHELGNKLVPPAFGENLTLEGATENDLMVGDTFEVINNLPERVDPFTFGALDPTRALMPNAIFEISQPRQPCGTLAARLNKPDMAKLIIAHGSTGFYFRVLRGGVIAPGATLKLIARGEAGVTIAEANRLLHRDKTDRVGIERVLSEPALSSSWRESFEKLKAAL